MDDTTPASSSRQTHSLAHTHNPIPSNSASSRISLPFRGSFANLARLIGLGSSGKDSHVNVYEDEDDVTDGDGDDDDEEDAGGEEGDVDEEGLMWDAQTALIAHQLDLAIRLYTQAALPPFCSPAACLALGNLLIRGSAFTEHDQHNQHVDGAKGKGRASLSYQDGDDDEEEGGNQAMASRFSTYTAPSNVFNRMFGSNTTKQTTNPSRPVPYRRPTVDLVDAGWQIPKDGKRAVRDAKAMGVAGAWFVLGLGWIVQSEMDRASTKESDSRNTMSITQPIRMVSSSSIDNIGREYVDEEMLSFDPKGKGKRFLPQTSNSRPMTPIEPTEEASTLSDSVSTLCPPKSFPSSSSGTTVESPLVQTPGVGLSEDPFNHGDDGLAEDLDALQTMFDLLQPLLKLYRHGHIQSQDPVALPPIALQKLPAALRPRNEKEKGRNVWYLGSVVMNRLGGLAILNHKSGSFAHSKNAEKLRGGVNIVTNYILAMTSHGLEAEKHFRNVIAHTPTGFDAADDLIRQAAKRLDIITSSPQDENGMDGYPFPTASSEISTRLSPPKPLFAASSHSRRTSSVGLSHTHRRRKMSTSSNASISMSRIVSTPLKSSPSMASLSSITDTALEPLTIQPSENDCAISTLKRLHAQSMCDLTEVSAREEEETRWPTLDGWSISASDQADFGVCQQSQCTLVPKSHSNRQQGLSISPSNTLRAVASSPHFGTLASMHEKMASTASTPRRRLPFEPTGNIAPIDPALAAAEMSSCLTKHVTCGVCGVEGVNFPECRKCGLTFCSRDCRVGEDKAGNGKKHICGLWESKKVLSDHLPDSNVSSTIQAMSPVRNVSPTDVDQL
ncbi:uncharacterized protein IL334_002979 [Kwoniella shivajii]|uniref:MYND-type domain-containing protein n=1 Tax=Kwoniella shivajii TaxID=564305 RepID=A0ABZ1CWU6_9TREE|nr:hypothetical protein IL334_002979 [Kwoniella shivajii]